MANIRAAIRAKLLTLSDLTDVVGASGVYSPPVDAEIPLPYVTISLISGEPDRHLNGSTGIQRDIYEFNCYSASYDTLDTIKEAIIAGMHTADKETWSGFKIYSCTCTDVQDSSELEDDGSQTPNKRIYLEFVIVRSISNNN